MALGVAYNNRFKEQLIAPAHTLMAIVQIQLYKNLAESASIHVLYMYVAPEEIGHDTHLHYCHAYAATRSAIL